VSRAERIVRGIKAAADAIGLDDVLGDLAVFGAKKAAPRTLGQIMGTLPPEARAPRRTVPALPKPTAPLKPEHYVPLTEQADVRLQGPAARAITDFVGHEPETYARGLGTGVGIMAPDRLERAFAQNPASSDFEVQRYLQQAFEPVGSRLREVSGPAVKLYRHQGPTSYFGAEPKARNVLSWTAQPEVAQAFAGLQNIPKTPDMFAEDAIFRAEQAMAKTGRAQAGRWSFERNPEYPEYIDMYRDGEHITDTDDLRKFLEDENRHAAEVAARYAAEREQKAKNIFEAYVPLEDIVWATNRAGQHEFIVRNRPGAYYAVDKKGRLGGSEFKSGGLAVKRKKK